MLSPELLKNLQAAGVPVEAVQVVAGEGLPGRPSHLDSVAQRVTMLLMTATFCPVPDGLEP